MTRERGMRRVNEALREVIAAAIASELEDPRIGFVTVTSVETCPDLRCARVLRQRARRRAGARATRSRRCLLARPPPGARSPREMRMKHTPTLPFHYDDAPERGVRLSRLLEE